MNKHTYDTIAHRPSTTSKAMFDCMVHQRRVKPHDVLALFHFYAYAMVLQGTEVPKCTVRFAANSLQMSRGAVQKAKAELIRLGLIEEVHTNVIKNGRNTIQYFIQVNYFSE